VTKDSKIFCIGLSRTGTTSICHAFRQLGYTANHFPNGIRNIEKKQVSTDIPVVFFWKQGILEYQWPDARYILTYRDSDKWIEAATKFWTRWPALQSTKRRVRSMVAQAHEVCYGSVEFKRDQYLEHYIKHAEYVRNYFKAAPKGKFLEINICAGEGWEKLCSWLGEDIPGSAFPWRNTIADRARRRGEKYDGK